MTIDEARTSLAFHSGQHEDIHDSRWQRGFLGMLRPYQGALVAENFDDVMGCVIVLADELRGTAPDKRTIAALWAICHLGRTWGLEADGMLRSNGLIAAEDVTRLGEWIDCISYATMMLLDGCELEEALEPYRALAGNDTP